MAVLVANFGLGFFLVAGCFVVRLLRRIQRGVGFLRVITFTVVVEVMALAAVGLCWLRLWVFVMSIILLNVLRLPPLYWANFCICIGPFSFNEFACPLSKKIFSKARQTFDQFTIKYHAASSVRFLPS